MNLKHFGDVGNVIAAIGVIISLLVVAWEINGNTAAIRAEANLSILNRFSDSIDWLRDPEFMEVAILMRTDPAAVNDVRKQQFRLYTLEIFNTWEQAFIFHEEGVLSDASWNSWNRASSGRLGNAYGRSLWEQSGSAFSVQFQNHVNETFLQNLSADR